jgi:YYY domain-containing protein
MEASVEAALWWLAITALGWSIAPLLAYISPIIPDRGMSISRVLGILLWAYPLWISGSISHLGPKGFALPLLLGMAAVGWLHPEIRKRFIEWVSGNRGKVLTLELVGVLAFAATAIIRAHSPAAVGTEKPMEMAFIQAIYRYPVLPNPDPWFGGEPISYYHFGYFITAMLAVLSRIEPSIAFNLSLASSFALAAMGIYGAIRNILEMGLTGSRSSTVSGILAAISTFGLGTLMGLIEMLRSAKIAPPDLFAALGLMRMTTPYPGASSIFPQEGVEHWWWWRSSRVFLDSIPGRIEPSEVIAEFPFFSLLLGDLHPHVLSISIWGMLIGLAVMEFAAPITHKALRWVIFSIVLGGVVFTNAWDLPAAAGLLIGARLLGALSRGELSRRFRNILYDGLVMLIGAYILFLPFHINLHTVAKGIGISPVRSHPGQFLVHWGIWLLPLIALLTVRLWQQRHIVRTVPGMIGLVLAVLLGVLFGPVPALLALIIWATTLLLIAEIKDARAAPFTEPKGRKRKREGGEKPVRIARVDVVVPLWSLLLSLFLLMGAEFFYIRDVFEGSSPRMNTVFKFHYQAWLLMVPAIWALLASTIRHVRKPAKYMLATVSVCIFLLGALYPSAAIPSRWESKTTLDAAAFLPPEERAAIRWLKENAETGAILAEAVGNSYSEYARISTFSGVPAVLGWIGHEQQWRGNIPAIADRQRAVESIYKATTPDALDDAFRRYGVTFIVVGPRERAAYGSLEQRMSQWLQPVFRSENGTITIYKNKPAS